MNIRQKNTVWPKIHDIPTLIEHGGENVAYKEMRHASASSLGGRVYH